MLLDHSAAICGSAVARAPNGQAAAAVRQVFAAVRLQAAACPPPSRAPNQPHILQ
jgi:hypothetical protein